MEFHKDDRGVFHPLLVTVIVVVLAVIGYAGYKVSNKNSAKSSSTGTTAAVNNSAAEASCNKEISDKTFCKFVSHFTLTTSYKATITSTDSSGMVSKIEMSNDSKSNTSLVSKDGNGKETSAFITLDGASYIKNESDGSWTKYGSSTSSSDTKPTSDIKVDTNDITEKGTLSYKNLGTEKCGSLTCYKYQVVDSTNAGTTQYMWFDNKNYLMQRWYNKDSSGTMDMSFSYQSVNITAPSPVKEASTTGSQSQADWDATVQAAQHAADVLNQDVAQ